ncbi:MAG: InlB B-repeat-containing protein, partial [Clostridia bacterium]|nr:InlB B-repeat-containing protein [Clostridia bacterium]
SKDGYAFVSWFTKENGEGDSIVRTYNIEGDTTYYAYFTNKVTYRFRIVNLEGKQQTIIPYTEVLYGTVISAPAISEYADHLPERYYIEGWYTSSSYATEFDFSKPLIQVNTSIYGKLAECTSHIWAMFHMNGRRIIPDVLLYADVHAVIMPRPTLQQAYRSALPKRRPA